MPPLPHNTVKSMRRNALHRLVGYAPRHCRMWILGRRTASL